MKKILCYFLMAFIGTSCASRKNGNYEKLDVERFNQNISNRVDINSGGELAELFYNWSPHNETPKFEINTKEVKPGEFEITLIHLDVPEKNIKDIKLELKAKRQMQVWTVLEARKNWKCRSGGGKNNWSNDKCK